MIIDKVVINADGSVDVYTGILDKYSSYTYNAAGGGGWKDDSYSQTWPNWTDLFIKALDIR